MALASWVLFLRLTTLIDNKLITALPDLCRFWECWPCLGGHFLLLRHGDRCSGSVWLADPARHYYLDHVLGIGDVV